MNENLNLVEILKDCPEGTKLYSPVYGDVEFVKVQHDGWDYPIEVKLSKTTTGEFTKDGRLFLNYDGGNVCYSPAKTSAIGVNSNLRNLSLTQRH